MAGSKSKSGRRKGQFGLGLGEVERQYLKQAADRLSAESPTEVGLGPFLVWAAKREAEKLLGISFTDYEAQHRKKVGR
jgi:hypothetical protein